MKKIVILITAVLIFSSCERQYDYREVKDYLIVDKNGIMNYKGSPLTGKINSFDFEKKLHTPIATFKDGKREGFWETRMSYAYGGSLYSQGEYLSGEEVGECKYYAYFPIRPLSNWNGRISSLINYDNGEKKYYNVETGDLESYYYVRSEIPYLIVKSYKGYYDENDSLLHKTNDVGPFGDYQVEEKYSNGEMVERRVTHIFDLYDGKNDFDEKMKRVLVFRYKGDKLLSLDVYD